MHSVVLAPSLLHVLMLPDFDRADAIGGYWGSPRPAPTPSSDRMPGGPDAPGRAGRHAAGVPTPMWHVHGWPDLRSLAR